MPKYLRLYNKNGELLKTSKNIEGNTGVITIENLFPETLYHEGDFLVSWVINGNELSKAPVPEFRTLELMDNKTIVVYFSDITEEQLIALKGDSAYKIALDNGFRGTQQDWLESLKGEPGEQGEPGKDGVDITEGGSAYEIALAEGFEGTRKEWLESLKGEPGEPGEPGRQGDPGEDGFGVDGASAYEIALENGFVGNIQDFLDSLVGEPGRDGQDGNDGLSAYEIAKEYGYTGTEQEWLEFIEGRLRDEYEEDLTNLKLAYRHTKGTSGSEDAINTIIGYKDNNVVSGVRGSHVQQGSKNNENIVGGIPDTVGVDAKNVIDPSITNAHYAFIGGYDNVNNALAGTLLGYHCYISDLATHGAIYGGSYHKILDGDYAFIGGGTKNLIKNTEGGNYGFLLGGSTNKLYGRFGGILGGMNNRVGNETVNKEYSSVVGSYLSTVDGNYSTILNGNECKATKDYTMVRGKGAVANNVGESVFSTGKFKTAGDSGQSTLHLLRQTTTGIETQLLCDDNGSSILTPIGVNTTLTITGIMSGHRVDSEGFASFKFTAVLTRGSGDLTVQHLNVEKLFVSDEAYNMNIKVNPTLNSYQILAQGVQGHTINWTAKVDTVWSRNI